MEETYDILIRLETVLAFATEDEAEQALSELSKDAMIDAIKSAIDSGDCFFHAGRLI